MVIIILRLDLMTTRLFIVYNGHYDMHFIVYNGHYDMHLLIVTCIPLNALIRYHAYFLIL